MVGLLLQGDAIVRLAGALLLLMAMKELARPDEP